MAQLPAAAVPRSRAQNIISAARVILELRPDSLAAVNLVPGSAQLFSSSVSADAGQKSTCVNCIAPR